MHENRTMKALEIVLRGGGSRRKMERMNLIKIYCKKPH
jgi:hypothetical protein